MAGGQCLELGPWAQAKPGRAWGRLGEARAAPGRTMWEDSQQDHTAGPTSVFRKGTRAMTVGYVSRPGGGRGCGLKVTEAVTVTTGRASILASRSPWKDGP